MTEICARCKESGEDRRTLLAACFYEMDELQLPFEKQIFLRANPKDLHPVEEPPKSANASITPEAVLCTGELIPQRFYTLRVCKQCRADWLAAIQTWFHTQPTKEHCNSGIFIRRNGATVEISEEKWYQLYPNREPVRYTPA